MANFTAYCKKVFSRFAQILYLTISNFTKNALWESAAACAFGFIFSFIPITLIIFAVLIAAIQIYPNIYNFILNFANQIESIVDIKPLLNRLMETGSTKSFNIFLIVWVIWMARKLFNSIISSINKVFRSVSKRKSWFNQLLTFIIEFTMTLIIAVIILFAFTFTQIIELPVIKTIFENFQFIFKQSSQNLGTFVLYFILFVSTTIAYRVIPGTKPLIRHCIFYAALSTLSFFIVSFFINLFMNVTNYNTIYGTISSLVLLMMKVYIFFNIFLFCAQMIYVSQFFETLLRSEIYLLPNYKSHGMGNYLRRMLFISPAEIQTLQNTIHLAIGDKLFSKEDKVNYVYYIMNGAITADTSSGLELRTQGSFLGDTQCLLNEPYNFNATALSECELIRFSKEEFMQIIQRSSHATRKALSKIAEYTAEA